MPDLQKEQSHSHSSLKSSLLNSSVNDYSLKAIQKFRKKFTNSSL